MIAEPKFATITGWACPGKGEKLVKYEYKPRPLGANDVEIEIEFCGICGSDLHTMNSGWYPTAYPCITGHEIVGKVVTTGSAVDTVKIGDTVGVGCLVHACLKSTCTECSMDLHMMCKEMTFTYNAKYPDGTPTQGGYANAIRVNSQWVFEIPEEIKPEHAASLLCAGVTVYSPMVTRKFTKGQRVGIVGIGGLGHLAVQFASKLGCEVTAISILDNKEDCIKLGATRFVNTTIAEEAASLHRSLDYLIITCDASGADLAKYMRWVDFYGEVIMIGIPEGTISLAPFALLGSTAKLSGSLIGGIQMTKNMLAFAAKHGIRPMIEEYPMDKVNEAVQHVREGKARYRAVLKN